MGQFQTAPDYGYLFLDFNSYFASVEQQDNPRLRGRPIAVAPVDSDSTCAIAASYEAKAYGIRTGTKIYEARRLCPDLIVVPARHDVYVTYHHRLMEEVERHVPVTKVCSIDEAYCELLGTDREHENARALVKRLKAGIRARVGECLTSSVGIAATPLLAKIASDMQKPDGLVFLKLADLPMRFSALRLRDLPGIGANMERRLFAAGITTIEALWNLAPKHVRMLWGGVGGERFWYELHGHVIPEQPSTKRVVGHSRMLDPRLRSPHATRLVGRALILKAARRLRRYGLASGSLTLSVSTVLRERWSGEVSFTATQDSFTFLQHYDRLWQPIRARVSPHARFRKISIMLHGLTPIEERQPDLFDLPSEPVAFSREKGLSAQDVSERLWQMIDDIETRHGRNTLMLASQRAVDLAYLGSKIAFTRIPDEVEFRE